MLVLLGEVFALGRKTRRYSGIVRDGEITPREREEGLKKKKNPPPPITHIRPIQKCHALHFLNRQTVWPYVPK